MVSERLRRRCLRGRREGRTPIVPVSKTGTTGFARVWHLQCVHSLFKMEGSLSGDQNISGVCNVQRRHHRRSYRCHNTMPCCLIDADNHVPDDMRPRQAQDQLFIRMAPNTFCLETRLAVSPFMSIAIVSSVLTSHTFYQTTKPDKTINGSSHDATPSGQTSACAHSTGSGLPRSVQELS